MLYKGPKADLLFSCYLDSRLPPFHRLSKQEQITIQVWAGTVRKMPVLEPVRAELELRVEKLQGPSNQNGGLWHTIV